MRAPLIAAAVIAAMLTPGCGDDRVHIAFHPAPGATYDYDTTIESTTRTELHGRASVEEPQAVRLSSHQRVLDVAGATIRVEVTLTRPGSGARTYVMRFDRAAQLTAVESVEGIPAQSLGDLGLSEIFPAAAGAPPDRPLRPGDRWTIDDRVQLSASDPPTQLEGVGRLRELGVVDGHRTATVVSSTSLPLRSVTTSTATRQTLDGTQRTQLTIIYDLSDGAVQHVSSVTTALYAVTIEPPAGTAGDPIVGSLTVVVRSEITRRHS
jgi:hypothetical protein